MADYRGYFDHEFLFFLDLAGRDVVVEIARIESREVVASGGRKARRPLVFFKGKRKGLVLNATNGRTIADLYGVDADGWIGKRIVLFPDVTNLQGQQVECIRIRPTVPEAPGEGGGSR